jgi:hypothetical protein
VQDKNAGQQFYGCSNSRRCKTLLPVEDREDGVAKRAA